METDPNYNQVAQTCHIAIGALILSSTIVLGGSISLGLILLTIWTLLKEYVWDIFYEHDSPGWKNADGIGSSLQDFTFYWIGGIGMVLLLLLHKL